MKNFGRGLLVALLCAAGPAKGADAVFAHPASAAELATLTRPTALSLEKARAVRGKFVQRRYLADLAQPLQSSGQFLFAREAGIEWHTELPFDSQFLLAESGITQRDDGGVTLTIKASEQPALAVVSRVFFALFALDIGALSHDFELYGEARGAGWVLGLKPRAEALGSVFRQAIVSGGATVERVVLEDGNGDRSEIILTGVSYDPAGMTADERRRF
ncbi:MAG: outer membrane lipoprotein carrier protein LolA [Pseudomonadota bacterium]